MFATLKGAITGGCLLALASTFVVAAAPNTPLLIQAIRDNDVQSVRALLKRRADVNAPQGDGATAIHWAAHLDNLPIAELLIRAGARVDAANDNGFTPLHLACTNRSPRMVERLLAAGASANAVSLNGETVLMTCARAGAPQAVKALLMRGADVNARERAHDQTALMWAASQRHSEAVQLLIEAGADVRARSRIYPQTVVSEATQRAGREELNYMVLRGGSTPLLFTARVGDVESARLLLAAGADANDSLPDGTSALVLAAHSGAGDVAALLLQKGADPNASGSGYTALHAAILKSDVDLVKALLAHGANPDVRMTKGTPLRRDTTDFNLPATLIGSTPYLLATRFLEPAIMRVLVAGGADPALTLPNGATAVMVASGMGSGANANRRGIAVIDFGKVEPQSQVLETVKVALELSGNVNAVSNSGDTALHAAASLGHESIVQFLVDQGADINVKNKRGQTPLRMVLSSKSRDENANLKMVGLLRTLGAAE